MIKIGYNIEKLEKEDDRLLSKTVEFINAAGQKIKVIEIPVLEKNDPYYFMVQVRLQMFISSLNSGPQEKNLHSFREYLKQKMKWSEFKLLYSMQAFPNNA